MLEKSLLDVYETWNWQLLQQWLPLNICKAIEEVIACLGEEDVIVWIAS